MNDGRSLGVVLSDPIRLFLLDDDGDTDIYFDNRIFVDSGLGRSIGFYDWLRSANGKIIGARTSFLLDSGVGDFRERLASNSAVEWNEASFMLFFSSDRTFDPRSSGDQEFGIHRLAIASNGPLLLTYDIKLLSHVEGSDLRKQVNSFLLFP